MKKWFSKVNHFNIYKLFDHHVNNVETNCYNTINIPLVIAQIISKETQAIQIKNRPLQSCYMRRLFYDENTVLRAVIEGEKKYSPPRETIKSVVNVKSRLGLEGSNPEVKRDWPLLAPMIGSNPGVGSLFPKMKLEDSSELNAYEFKEGRCYYLGLFAQDIWRKRNPCEILDWYATEKDIYQPETNKCGSLTKRETSFDSSRVGGSLRRWNYSPV